MIGMKTLRELPRHAGTPSCEAPWSAARQPFYTRAGMGYATNDASGYSASKVVSSFVLTSIGCRLRGHQPQRVGSDRQAPSAAPLLPFGWKQEGSTVEPDVSRGAASPGIPGTRCSPKTRHLRSLRASQSDAPSASSRLDKLVQDQAPELVKSPELAQPDWARRSMPPSLAESNREASGHRPASRCAHSQSQSRRW